MADGIFNEARGSVYHELSELAKDVQVILLQAAETDDALVDHDTVSALLAAAGNDEATFTNYTRQTVSNGNITITVDDTNNRLDIDIPDQTWSAAGNGTNNSLVKVVVCTDGADDTARLPLTHHDISVTTDGSNLTVEFATAGFYRSE